MFFCVESFSFLLALVFPKTVEPILIFRFSLLRNHLLSIGFQILVIVPSLFFLLLLSIFFQPECFSINIQVTVKFSLVYRLFIINLPETDHVILASFDFNCIC